MPAQLAQAPRTERLHSNDFLISLPRKNHSQKGNRQENLNCRNVIVRIVDGIPSDTRTSADFSVAEVHVSCLRQHVLSAERLEMH